MNDAEHTQNKESEDSDTLLSDLSAYLLTLRDLKISAYLSTPPVPTNTPSGTELQNITMNELMEKLNALVTERFLDINRSVSEREDQDSE